jgi:hypothetical protein
MVLVMEKSQGGSTAAFAHGPDLDVTGNQKWKLLRNPKPFHFRLPLIGRN